MEVKRAGDVCCGRKKYWKKQQRQNRRWVESRLQEDPGGKSDLNHHFTGFHSSVQKTPALKGKWFLCHIFCWDFATALVINSWVKSSDTAHFFLLSFSWVQCIQVVFLTFICYPAYLWLMFPLDPSTPIRICSVVVLDPIFYRPSSASKLFPPPLGRSYPPADAEIFLLRLSHKDGIKKVENTSALAFSLQTAGMIRRQSCCKVNMQLIEVDIRYLRHELQLFLLPKSFRW